MIILRDFQCWEKARFVKYLEGEYPKLRKPAAKIYLKDCGIKKTDWKKVDEWLKKVQRFQYES